MDIFGYGQIEGTENEQCLSLEVLKKLFLFNIEPILFVVYESKSIFSIRLWIIEKHLIYWLFFHRHRKL